MELTGIYIVIFSGCIFSFGHSASYEDDEIRELPGLPSQPKFKHYSGYLKSSETRRLHYWLTESERSPETDPLVVWLNGGPGCSSLNGLFTENGPYLDNSDGGESLRYNEYAWNKIANVLFLESPAGVGFSYATDRKYDTDDDQTADDNFRALVDFYDKFPHYRHLDLVITGESYAGVYIPTLLDRLRKHPNIKLKVLSETLKILQLNIDRYNILDPCIIESSVTRATSVTKRWATEALSLIFRHMQGNNVTENLNRLRKMDASSDKSSFVPCVPSGGLVPYLNRPDVQRAIHVLPSEVTGLPPWTGCSSVVDDAAGTYHSTYPDQYDVLARTVSSKKYDILIYYGDLDFLCSLFTGQHVLKEVARRAELQHTSDHAPWYYTASDGSRQIGGFAESYERFMYLTFKGSGHMVPTDVPLQSLEILRRYLDGSLFEGNR